MTWHEAAPPAEERLLAAPTTTRLWQIAASLPTPWITFCPWLGMWTGTRGPERDQFATHSGFLTENHQSRKTLPCQEIPVKRNGIGQDGVEKC